jgi:exosortase
MFARLWKFRGLFIWLPLLGFWLLALRNLAAHWSVNQIYSYGWLVPLFGVVAAFNRWQTRPAPGIGVRLGLWVTAAAALLFFPTWVFEQPNPDWSLVGWVMTGLAVTMTLGVIAFIGGWSWLWHFAFPACFIFTAVPWPRFLEAPLTVGLMSYVTSFTVELLNFVGVAALQHGNLLEIRGGLLGVEEACSGVRSLQATLMASVFLGELHRMTWGRRVLLLFAGFLVALTTNVGRTFYLSLSAANSGLPVITARHDPAGFTTLAFCFASVWVISLLLSRNDVRFEHGSNVLACRAVSLRFAGGLTLWFLGMLGVTEVWYHDDGKTPERQWTFAVPVNSEAVKLDPAVIAQLQCDGITSATWREVNGAQWALHLIEWNPGPLRSRVLARVHRPEVCLSAIGMKLLKDRGIVSIAVADLTLPFRAYTFEQNGRAVFVYFGVWQNRTLRGRGHGQLSESEHVAGLQAVLWRERNLGQQVAEVAVTGYASGTEADAQFRATMRDLVIVKPTAGRDGEGSMNGKTPATFDAGASTATFAHHVWGN